MPRHRKPTHLKAVQGTLRKHRVNNDEPKASPDSPVKPDHLTGRAAEKFAELVSIIDRMGIASSDDTDAIALLARTLASIERDGMFIDENGPDYTPDSGNGTVHSHPASRRMVQSIKLAQSLLNEFGLTPAARSKVSARKASDTNPFSSV